MVDYGKVDITLIIGVEVRGCSRTAHAAQAIGFHSSWALGVQYNKYRL
jgi:hypothetical protein